MAMEHFNRPSGTPLVLNCFEPYGIESISVGDVNNDGKPDLIIAGSLQDFSSSALVTVMLGMAMEPFSPSPALMQEPFRQTLRSEQSAISMVMAISISLP